MESSKPDDIILAAEDVHKVYRTGAEELHILRGVDLSIRQGEILFLVGASGAGKSTLLNILGGLDRPTTGKVTFSGGVDLGPLRDEALSRFRVETVGFVFQFHHLLPEFTTLENVMMPILLRGRSPVEADRTARAMLERVGLTDRIDHRPPELSGGEQQRTAVARALVNRPRVVLADEPTGNLDEETGEKILELLWDLNARDGQTFVIVTHNAALTRRRGRCMRLAGGTLNQLEKAQGLGIGGERD